MKKLTVWGALSLLVATAACEKKANPIAASDAGVASSASVLDAKTGVTITTPALVAPADNADIKNSEQPVTLVTSSAVTTSKSGLTYSFEVATDSGFNNKVYTKEGVAGANGQTRLTIDKLAPDTTYFWRARSTVNGTAGLNSKARTFKIGPEVILQTPALSAPGANATVGEQPTLTVNNVQRQGPAGEIFYLFEISDSPSFDNIFYSATEPENAGAGFTQHAVAQQLPETVLWWRVQASDPANKVTSPFSVANPFRVQRFDMRKAIIYDNQPGVAYWPETAKITYADTAGPYIVVDFDRRVDQPGMRRWNDVGFGSGSLEYTLGACFYIDGQWYCSAAVQFWHGRELQAGGPTSQMALNWYYNPARWGRMSGHQPARGEVIGLWVGQGNLRGGDGYTYKERSNVQLVQFGTTWSASSLTRLPLK